MISMLNKPIAWRKNIRLRRGFLSTVAIMLFVLALISCAGQPLAKVEPIPNADVPIENINTYIKLDDDPNLMNSHKNQEVLTLRIINLSTSSILFPEEYHAQVFMQEEGKWVEVQNNFYNTGDRIILPTKEAWPLGLLVSYLPIAPISKPTIVRVSVDGYLEENEQVRVGAYFDFQLKP